MEFGMFHELPSLAGRPHADAFSEAFEQIDAAEKWGLDAIWLAELHFAPDRSLLSAPLIVASAIAASTRRIKIGIAVQVLPLGHPLRLAEEAATVDQISHGRLIFGVGRSGVVQTYDAYGVPYAESRERFAETLDIIRQAWAHDKVSYHGTYHSFSDIAVVPRPYRQPSPPIRIAANTIDTAPMIGEMGLPMFVSARHINWTELAHYVRHYQEAYAAAGHPGKGEVFLSVPTYVAETEAQARADAAPSIMQFYRQQAELQADLLSRSAAPAPARVLRLERLRNMSYEQAQREHVLVGTPATIIDRLHALREELTLGGILAELNCGGIIPHRQVMSALRLLCEEVAPQLR